MKKYYSVFNNIGVYVGFCTTLKGAQQMAATYNGRFEATFEEEKDDYPPISEDGFGDGYHYVDQYGNNQHSLL